MLGLSLVLVALGVYTATRAENLTVSGYVSGVMVGGLSSSGRRTQWLIFTLWSWVQLTLGSFLALLGLGLEENRHQLVSSVAAVQVSKV